MARSVIEIEMEIAATAEKIHNLRERGQNWDSQIRRLQILFEEINKATRGRYYRPGHEQRMNIRC